MSTIGKRIESKAIEIIKSNPRGIRHSDLVDAIHQQLPDHPNINTIRGEIWESASVGSKRALCSFGMSSL